MVKKTIFQEKKVNFLIEASWKILLACNKRN